MAIEQELNKKSPLHEEFQTLLDKDFKDRKLKENEIIKATVTEITKNFVVVDCKAKMEGMIPIEEFKNEFNELKKMGKLDWDAEALVENYYDEIGKIVDKLEKLLNDEDLIFGNPIDDINTGPGGVDVPVTLGEVAEMNMTNQEPRLFEDL